MSSGGDKSNRWYVNLPHNHSKRQGPYVKMRVKSSGLKDWLGMAQWLVEPVGSDNEDEKYLGRNDRARVDSLVTWNENDKGEFTNRLIFPHVGGDKYKVKVSKFTEESKAVESREYETWRKLYYTVHHMNSDCSKLVAAVSGKFEKVYADSFIELELASQSATLKDEKHTKDNDVALSHLYNNTPALENKPHHLRLIVLNNIYEKKIKRYNWTTTNLKFSLARTMLPLAPHPIKKLFIRAPGERTWTPVSGASANGERSVEIDLSKNRIAQRLLKIKGRLRVRLITRERDDYCGYSKGNLAVVRVNEPGGKAAAQITALQTLTHELGHGCQQVVEFEWTYNSLGILTGVEGNSEYYVGHGGVGPHCATNAKINEKTVDPTGGDLCTMYHAAHNNVQKDGEFCAECVPRLKRVNMAEMDEWELF